MCKHKKRNIRRERECEREREREKERERAIFTTFPDFCKLLKFF